MSRSEPVYVYLLAGLLLFFALHGLCYLLTLTTR